MQKVLSITLLLIATVLVRHNTVAQQIKVISSVDNSPLPYATVTNRTHPWVVSADRNGIAQIAAVPGDTLTISYVGYKTALLRFNGNNVQVSLLQDQKILPLITIHSCRKTKEFSYNNIKAIKGRRNNDELKKGFAGVIWSKGSNINAKIAVRLIPSRVNATLKDFSFWIEQAWQSPKSSVLTPLLISLYEVSDSTNLPGELLSNAPLFYFPQKSGKQTVNLDSLHVTVPSNGIYVSLQYIMNEEYEWKQLSWHKDSTGTTKIDSVIYRYGGLITGVRSKDFDLVWYNGIKDEWVSLGSLPIPNGNVHSSIKCEATFKFCDDE